MTEEWKDIEGYEGYQVSNLGRVKNVKTGRILKAGSNNGYLYVSLSKNGKSQIIYVHRLVGSSFLPNPDDFPEINHKDEDKTNNRVENLEWCDRIYNINYGGRTKKAKEKQINCPQKSKSVLALKDNKICLYFASTMEAQRKGFNSGTISQCALGKRKTHKGFRWIYLEDYLADWWDMEMERVA